ncbi:MAG: YgeY family selenium metabolism-linked hydrolase [Synergistaceae bacterium]|nr:YgeY family selenium metabolism-linked hydrolase [Synergistaceae bacterium]
MLSENRKKMLRELCQDAIRTKSPSGREEGVASLLGKTMRKLGFARVETDRLGNVVGQIPLGGGGKRLLLEGHMDHVGPGDLSKWVHDPWGAEIEDGKLYGRGTSDMKGNLCAMLMAAAFVAEDEGGTLRGEILVAGSVHEECFEGVASEEIGKKWRPDGVIIGEASSLNLKRGQKGRAEVLVETLGKPAHSSRPSAGINAVKKMSRLIMDLEKNFVPPVHPVLGDGILEVTDIVSSPWPGASVIPERCRATFDRRLLPGESEADVLEPLERIFERLTKEDPTFQARAVLAAGREKCCTGADIEATRFAPGWILEENHPFVQKALEGLRSVGQNPELSHYTFCTNGSYYAGKAGIPTLGYGGSLEALAHTTDEYIELEQLYAACEGYCGIIRAILKQ